MSGLLSIYHCTSLYTLLFDNGETPTVRRTDDLRWQARLQSLPRIMSIVKHKGSRRGHLFKTFFKNKGNRGCITTTPWLPTQASAWSCRIRIYAAWLRYITFYIYRKDTNTVSSRPSGVCCSATTKESSVASSPWSRSRLCSLESSLTADLKAGLYLRFYWVSRGYLGSGSS